MRIVGLLEEEFIEILNIFEEMNSLKGMLRLFASDDELFLRESKVYENLKEDYNKNQKDYSSWWGAALEKYGLEKSEAGRYQVDFGKKAIIKMD